MPCAQTHSERVPPRSARAIVAIALATLLAAACLALSSPDRADAAPSPFETDGSTILAPDGSPFIPVGANFMGPHGFWPRDTIGKSQVADEAWRFNTIRLNTCMPGGCDGTGWDWGNNNDLDRLVDEWTGRGIVVMVELHQVQPGSWPTATQMPAIEDWWRDIASRYQDNPYVWFNLLNEPGHGLPVPDTWRSVHQRLIDVIRGAGAGNMIVVDGTHWGQDAGNWNTEPVPEQNSAILTYGPQLQDPLDRLTFSVHVYDQWGAEGTDAARDARLGDYIARVRGKGLPLVIGETGAPADRSNGYLTRGTEAAYRVASDHGVGVLAWHAQPGDGFALTTTGSFDALDSWSSPTTLNWHGQLLWTLAHEVAAGAGSGGSTTTTTTTTTTTAPPTRPSSELLVSTSPDRSGAVPLEGRTVDGRVYVVAATDSGGRVARFWLDDPDRTGSPRQTERVAPFDFAGGNKTTAKPLDTATLPEGQHVITAEVEHVDGHREVVHATFSVGTPAGDDDDPVAEAGSTLEVSTSADRSSAQPLAGRSLSGASYIFAVSERPDVTAVEFWLDDPTMVGTPRRTEKLAPFDFAGGDVDTANAWHTSWVPAGTHVITARLTHQDGTRQVVHATFTTS